MNKFRGFSEHACVYYHYVMLWWLRPSPKWCRARWGCRYFQPDTWRQSAIVPQTAHNNNVRSQAHECRNSSPYL